MRLSRQQREFLIDLYEGGAHGGSWDELRLPRATRSQSACRSRMIRRLVDRGLVAKARHYSDRRCRRVKEVCLTTEGIEVAEKLATPTNGRVRVKC